MNASTHHLSLLLCVLMTPNMLSQRAWVSVPLCASWHLACIRSLKRDEGYDLQSRLLINLFILIGAAVVFQKGGRVVKQKLKFQT